MRDSGIEPRLLRWLMVRAIEASRPTPISERMLYRVLNGSDCPISPREVRREMDFLALRGLISIDQSDPDFWEATTTADGALFAQGDGPEVPGIDRPGGRP